MKRVVLILLCLCFILSGCLKGSKVDNDLVDDDQSTIDQEIEEVIEKPRMSTEQAEFQMIDNNKPRFVMPNYTAKVAPYTISKNLDNIVNMSQFMGFTDEQRHMLVENGFVVLPSRDSKMFYVYDNNEYSGIPNFITTDSVLHTFHHFYDKSLMHVESAFLYDDLKLMTEQMLEKSIALGKVLEDEQLKQLQDKNIIYFLVSQMLIDPTSPLTEKVSKDLMDIAKQEIELIEEANTFTQSPLFDYDLDYSQFTIRGHYTRSEVLGVYFKTMMWYGTAALPYYDASKTFLYDNTLQSLLITLTTFMESKSTDDIQLWSNIYLPTGQYVGLSDDIHVVEMNDLRIAVFGEGHDPNILNDESYYEQLVEAVNALREPQIQGKFTMVTTPTGKQFRFLGQRYILDSFIMQELMEPIVRPIPSGLDVMGVLGSATAEHHVFNVLKPQLAWPDYEPNYRELKDIVSNYTEELWGNNLYNGWLWSIQEALTEFADDSGMPLFMLNEGWRNKSLNTALGSYTELKHDTVLYGKQPAAQMGGPIAFATQHYVEPNIPLYSKLLYLTDYTMTVLEQFNMLNDTIGSGAEQFKALLEFLIECSIKQLNNEALSEEESNQLLWYGGQLEHITLMFLMGLADDHSPTELSDMLVTDVATIAPSIFAEAGYLSLGTGYFDHIYVVVPIEDELFLTRGSVYSYYEFLSRTRLTDEQWWELHGIQKISDDNGTYLSWTEPSDELSDQPFWVEAFKSKSNDVIIEPLEIDWDRLNE